MPSLTRRPRRLRQSSSLRQMVRETHLKVSDLIWPVFVMEGSKSLPVASLPGVYRWCLEDLVQECREAFSLGIRAVALFPVIEESKKDALATESCNPEGLLQKAVQRLKKELPDLCLITDVAMDPYSSDGHDGIVENGVILNDESLAVLTDMAIAQAKAGADIVAPSDMMDGRVSAIRQGLDEAGFTQVAILSYAVKYASSFYGPFRDALDSAPKSGDKKTYQMDPANLREALVEAQLDELEGADMLMVKPGMPYLDVVKEIRESSPLPLVVYQVSGEYAMLHAAVERGWLDEEAAFWESMLGFKRAGADLIITYQAKKLAHLLKERSY